MAGFIIRMLITALGLWIADALLGGVHMEGSRTILWAALLLGVVNAIVRPVLVVLTLPITILSLGIFLLVINGVMVALVAAMLNGFVLDSLGSAMLAAVIVTITGWMGNAFVGTVANL